MNQPDCAFFFDEHCLWHYGAGFVESLPVGGWVQPSASTGFVESPDSKRRLKSLMDVAGLTAQLAVQRAPSASEEELLRIHPAHYLRQIKQMSNSGGGLMEAETPCGPGGYEIACLSAGLAIEAVASICRGDYRTAYALTRPPGHHCLPENALGFCLLANIAIAIESAKAYYGLGKVAVIDWDVHHGNGTQHIFYHRDDVLTLSLHQENCFPAGYSGEKEQGAGKGEGYNINIPLLPGSGHDAYLYAFEKIVEPALLRFAPELIIVACGYDANGMDPLARMQLHSDSFRSMTERVVALAKQCCQGRVVMAHEGGYSESYVPFCGIATLEALSGVKTAVQDPLLELISLQQPSAPHLALQRSLIDNMAKAIFAA